MSSDNNSAICLAIHKRPDVSIGTQSKEVKRKASDYRTYEKYRYLNTKEIFDFQVGVSDWEASIKYK